MHRYIPIMDTHGVRRSFGVHQLFGVRRLSGVHQFVDSVGAFPLSPIGSAVRVFGSALPIVHVVTNLSPVWLWCLCVLCEIFTARNAEIIESTNLG